MLDALPAAVYTTDAAGRITYYNQAAADLAGREPQLGSDEWCVTWRLYDADGTPLPHDRCPMAVGDQGKPGGTRRRGGAGAAGRDARTVRSLSDAAA